MQFIEEDLLPLGAMSTYSRFTQPCSLLPYIHLVACTMAWTSARTEQVRTPSALSGVCLQHPYLVNDIVNIQVNGHPPLVQEVVDIDLMLPKVAADEGGVEGSHSPFHRTWYTCSCLRAGKAPMLRNRAGNEGKMMLSSRRVFKWKRGQGQGRSLIGNDLGEVPYICILRCVTWWKCLERDCQAEKNLSALTL